MEPEIEVRKLGLVMVEPHPDEKGPYHPIPCDVRYFYAPVTETHNMWFRSEVDAAFPPELIEREHARRLESFRDRVRLAKANGEQPPRCEQWGNYRVYFPDEIKSIDVSKLEPLP